MRVLTIDLSTPNAGNAPTELDGFVLAGGNAIGVNGGGVFIAGGATGCIWRITRCCFFNNYARRGGAIYVDETVKAPVAGVSYIGQSLICNNVAGERVESANVGGGVYMAGQGALVNCVVANNTNSGVCMATGCRVLSSTVVRNAGGGIGMCEAYASPEPNVINTVVWGNRNLYVQNTPRFSYSAYPENIQKQPDTHNVTINTENNKADGLSTLFVSPSVTEGYDRLFEWRSMVYPFWEWSLEEGSVLIDRGASEAYDAKDFGTADLGGTDRFSAAAIDIGAYEFRTIASGRIRYVSQRGDNSDGLTWATAYTDVQRAIDELHGNGSQGEGEVWVAAGTYTPSGRLVDGEKTLPAFIMRDGIHVYGGFAGTETSRNGRERRPDGMPWEFVHETRFVGAGYDLSDGSRQTPEWNDLNSEWRVNSESNHVVWFADTEDVNRSFRYTTMLDGVTVMGGQAKASDAGVFHGDRGGGVFMHNANAYMRHCIVTENVAEGPGGGVWLSGGRIAASLIYNNSSNGTDQERNNGGGIYMSNSGIVLRSMITNNAAFDGAGIYLDRNGNYAVDGKPHPEYLILSTSIVTNNTARGNGAVYCDGAGVLLQNTINNNRVLRATDEADKDASRTAGLYIDGYGLVLNSVLWNNLINGVNVPMYATNASIATVRFMNNALSGMNNAVWNNILQRDLIELVDTNTAGEDGYAVEYRTGGQMPDDAALQSLVGVQPDWRWTEEKSGIDFFWEPLKGANLRAQGMAISAMPSEVMLWPEQDIRGKLFAQKPACGSHAIERQSLRPQLADGVLRLYVDADCTDYTHDGSSWEHGYRSLTEAVDYFAEQAATDFDLNTIERFEILVLEGDLYPRYVYSGNDYKTATTHIRAMPAGRDGRPLPLHIYGGYSRTAGADGGRERNPMTHRSIVTGRLDEGGRDEALYNCVTVDEGARVLFDGFYVTGGYTAPTAAVQYGAGMLILDGAEVEVRNCVFSDHEATEAAAIDARRATLALTNCVIHNNTNQTSSAPVINAERLTLNHVSLVHNAGRAAPIAVGAANNSFAAGNASGNTEGLITAVNERNFVNPTLEAGAGKTPYLGGYADFTPLTSSVESDAIINRGTASIGVTADIAGRDRTLGGRPDLGAYEADLLPRGRVYYVREATNGGSDLNDGLSWATAFASLRRAVAAAAQGEVIDGARPQVWVAAGTYSQDPEEGSSNCFEMVDGVCVYGAFPRTGNPGMGERHPLVSTEIFNEGTYSPDDYETILRPATDSSPVRRVLGQPDRYNPANDIFNLYGNAFTHYEYVGAGQGDYTYRAASYTPQEGGGWQYSETGGEYVEAEQARCDVLYVPTAGYYPVSKADNPTHKYATRYEEEARPGWGSLSRKYFVRVGVGYGRYRLYTSWGQQVYEETADGEYIEFVSGQDYYPASADYATHRWFEAGYHRVAAGTGNRVQLHAGWNELGTGHGTHRLGEAGFVPAGEGRGDCRRIAEGMKYDRFVYHTEWDGFTLCDGYVDSRHLDFLGNEGARNGGANAAVFHRAVVANSVLTRGTNERSDSGSMLRGGGAYSDGGSLIGCYILDNTAGDSNDNEAYGAGCYMYSGTAYNCVIQGNEGNGSYTYGAAIFIENAEFYNNTIVDNRSNGTTGNGGICIWQSGGSSRLTLYNCIVLDNKGFRGMYSGNKNLARTGGTVVCHNSLFESLDGTAEIVYDATCRTTQAENTFVDYAGRNYRLQDDASALNMGENIPRVNGTDIFLEDYNDMDFTARIKDCRVDAGAYEYDNTQNIAYEQRGDSCIYYVTPEGANRSNAASPDHAACAMKLQAVLHHAGVRVAEGRRPVVRVAEGDYYANTLTDPADPKSYSFVIPYGVTLEGGYTEDFTERNIFDHQTELVPQYTRAGQTVNGYHVVTFGEMPAGAPDGLRAVVDGFHLSGGRATATDGTARSRGGAAIVPAWGHVRNCTVHGNEAVEGGGLYLLPGATVSGTALQGNTAARGGAIYASNEGVTPDNRSHVVSVTVTDNKATSIGGGLYHEDAGCMVFNSVVWHNSAPSDKNVSGVFIEPYEDSLYTQMLAGEVPTTAFTPYNACFVETYNMPVTDGFFNASMQSENTYFASEYRRLRAYSELIKHGARTKYMTRLETLIGLATHDMAGVRRVQTGQERVDVGAFAIESGLFPMEDEAEIRNVIFVSANAEPVQLTEGTKMEDYVGRSFLTPISWLDDALEYIRRVRERHPDEQFSILMTGGEYPPRYLRDELNADNRNNSFEIPHGVSLYGGFSGREGWTDGLTDLPVTGGVDRELTPLTEANLPEALARRDSSDLNSNGVYEAYEFAHQTILSGNLADTERGARVYHVLYSAAEVPSPRPVVLDGVTVMDGDCLNSDLSDELPYAGRGGGIYSDGVPYIINRSRLFDNRAKEGGAVYVRDAGLSLFGSLVRGNEALGTAARPEGGGALCLIASEADTLRAANTVWANNETGQAGGSVAASGAGKVHIDLLNCLVVSNRAGDLAAISNDRGTTRLTNTVVWGNEATAGTRDLPAGTVLDHSAGDCAEHFGSLEAQAGGNLLLATQNSVLDGPRFARAAERAGVAGSSISSQWNPGAISVLTDAGNGVLAPDRTDPAEATGAYKDWMAQHARGYETQYMLSPSYRRYVGPRSELDGSQLAHAIDIGTYEYQYPISFENMDVVYVATTESGKADGSSWANATSDLRGAMIGLAHSNGRARTKHIYIRSGLYAEHRLYNEGMAYNIDMATESAGNTLFTDSLVIEGGYNEADVQDFSQPTVIGLSPLVAGETDLLLQLKTNGKTVAMSGLCFDGGDSAAGIVAEVDNAPEGSAPSTGGLVLRNSSFRHTTEALRVSNAAESDGTLLANVLFADNEVGLAGDAGTTVLNATFAKNREAATRGELRLYNSVRWENGDQTAQTATAVDDRRNVTFRYGQTNADILEGPNFTDPNKGDYTIRPGEYLLNKGDSTAYTTTRGVSPALDQDLAGRRRLVGSTIDVGAYEYNGLLQPVVYVNGRVVGGTQDGSSWENAMSDLQSAVDLASLYAHSHPGSAAYVFAAGGTSAERLELSSSGVKVYGGMNGETAAGAADVETIVSRLLAQRASILSGTARSTIADLTLSADGVVDGFEVARATLGTTATAGQAMLSTSLAGDVRLQAGGVLYNSLLRGTVSGAGRAVHVTLDNGATLSDEADTLYVAASVPDNAYISTPLWHKQLMEDSPYLDRGEGRDGIQSYMDQAGHARDLAGSPRLINERADYGCFETWHITPTTPQPAVTGQARPGVNHVVYVREGAELTLEAGIYAAGKTFSPGFLLLEHGAGLRSAANPVRLYRFAQERRLDSAGRDFAAPPFTVKRITLNGRDNPAGDGLTRYRYDGDERARHDYKYGESDTWLPVQSLDPRMEVTEGWLLESAPGDVVRFYGDSYAEDGTAKAIALAQHNYRDGWSAGASGGNRFTHAENMGWNLFGSPFLCSMNFDDMAYGRVIYPYAYAESADEGGDYDRPLHTWNRTTGEPLSGHVPVGTAVFTQTATLRDEEMVDVQPRTAERSEAEAYQGRLAVAFAPAGSTEADVVQLAAVPEAEAKPVYDLLDDGVKMRGWRDDRAQVYMLREGGRYALLSAVDREGEVALGVRVPAAGPYEFRIPAGCDPYDYEAVMLRDALLDRLVDLKESPYAVQASAPGEMNGRFSLLFRRVGDRFTESPVTIYTPGDGTMTVSGLQGHTLIRLYSSAGLLMEARTTTAVQELFRLPAGIYLVEISGDSHPTPLTDKIRVR